MPDVQIKATFNSLGHPADLDQLLEEQRAFRIRGADNTEYRILWPEALGGKAQLFRGSRRSVASNGTPTARRGVMA